MQLSNMRRVTLDTVLTERYSSWTLVSPHGIININQDTNHS